VFQIDKMSGVKALQEAFEAWKAEVEDAALLRQGLANKAREIETLNVTLKLKREQTAKLRHQVNEQVTLIKDLQEKLKDQESELEQLKLSPLKSPTQFLIPPPRGLQSMVEELKQKGAIRSLRVEEAMLAVNRAQFCVDGIANPYEDNPKPIGAGYYTATPNVIARALDVLQDYLKPESKVMYIGEGSGYILTLMAAMMGQPAPNSVVGIERSSSLSQITEQSIRKAGYGHLLDEGAICVTWGDEPDMSEPDQLYDVIYIGANDVALPDRYLDRLKNGGRMVSRVWASGQPPQWQTLDKDQNGQITRESIM